jgi:Carboxypeptidase C (cathepsin A)
MSPTTPRRRAAPSPSPSTAAGRGFGYLNLGLVGPRILEFPGNDAATARLQDNPQTWLGFTDLVMIDPVGTGWSRPAKADNGSAFYGVRQDAQTLAKTIALYLGKNGRGNSPKYLWVKATAGFAPPRWRRRCSATRASWCPAS